MGNVIQLIVLIFIRYDRYSYLRKNLDQKAKNWEFYSNH